MRPVSVQIAYGSRELYCVASVDIQRGDGDAMTVTIPMSGDTGHINAQIPSDWNSVSVRVSNLSILPSASSEPAVASPPGSLVANPVPPDTDLSRTVVFNYPSQTQTTEITVSRGAMQKYTEQQKTTVSGTFGVSLGAKLLLGDNKVIVNTTGGVSGSDESTTGSETGTSSSDQVKCQFTVTYVDFTLPPDVYINNKKI